MYTLTTQDSDKGGQHYPFLERLQRRWTVIQQPIDENEFDPLQHPAHTFAATRPTLRWINDDSLHDLYVEGLDTAAFLAETGLRLSLNKGGYVLELIETFEKRIRIVHHGSKNPSKGKPL